MGLFNRVACEIKLTAVGRDFLDEAGSVLSQADEARQMLYEFGGLERGRLSLAASQPIAGYWLPPVLVQFRQAHPGIACDLSIGNSEQAAARVHEGAAELGFVEGPIDDPALARWQVGKDRLALIGTNIPGNLDADALRKLDWVLREPGSGTRATLAAALRRRGIALDDLNLALTLPSNEAVLSVVAAGAGVTALSELVAEPLLTAGSVRSASFDVAPRPFFALRHKDRYPPKRPMRCCT